MVDLDTINVALFHTSGIVGRLKEFRECLITGKPPQQTFIHEDVEETIEALKPLLELPAHDWRYPLGFGRPLGYGSKPYCAAACANEFPVDGYVPRSDEEGGILEWLKKIPEFNRQVKEAFKKENRF